MTIAIYSIEKDIYKREITGNIFRRVTKSGKILFLCGLSVVIINFWKDQSVERKLKLASEATEAVNKRLVTSQDSVRVSQDSLKNYQFRFFALQLSIKDSINNKVDSSYAHSIKASNSALASYNLKISDSLHRVIGTLKLKSINTQFLLAAVDNEKPPIYLDHWGSFLVLKMRFISNGGNSSHIDIRSHIILFDGRNQMQILKTDTLMKKSFLIEGTDRTLQIFIDSSYLNLDIDLGIVLEGSYSKDIESTLIIDYNEFFLFNFHRNKFSGSRNFNFDVFKKYLIPRKSNSK